jgi:hypothetical protein
MCGALAGHDFPSDANNVGTIHVFYISDGKEVCELYRQHGRTPWFGNNLTASAVGGTNHFPYYDPHRIMPMISYVWPDDNSQHVIYIDGNQNVIDLWYVIGGGWTATPIGPW